jgi:hypothetical protein
VVQGLARLPKPEPPIERRCIDVYLEDGERDVHASRLGAAQHVLNCSRANSATLKLRCDTDGVEFNLSRLFNRGEEPGRDGTMLNKEGVGKPKLLKELRKFPPLIP